MKHNERFALYPIPDDYPAERHDLFVPNKGTSAEAMSRARSFDKVIVRSSFTMTTHRQNRTVATVPNVEPKPGASWHNEKSTWNMVG
jgi:hypothetical protein